VVRQDGEARSHTGGIVWETSYLLANYLLHRFGSGSVDGGDGGDGEKKERRGGRKRRRRRRPLGRVLEVGSGCGLLGLTLAASGLSERVVLTEAEEVLEDLRGNVRRNIRRRRKSGSGSDADVDADADAEETKGESEEEEKTALPDWRPCVSPSRASARRLRWDRLEEDVASCPPDGRDDDDDEGDDLRPHSFDVIVGTDVVFAPTLVSPLLKTLALMSRATTAIYLCLQVRCADSHRLLLERAGEYGFRVEDASDDFRDVPGCSWGEELECKLLRLFPAGKDGKGAKRPRDGAERKEKKKKKKKNRKKDRRT